MTPFSEESFRRKLAQFRRVHSEVFRLALKGKNLNHTLKK